MDVEKIRQKIEDKEKELEQKRNQYKWDENEIIVVNEIVYKHDEPRCINCHRVVEFFKDLDEVE